MRSRRAELIEALYVMHYVPLLRFAYLLTGGEGAEDLVQEAFVRALRKWDPDSPPEAFRAWTQKTLLRLHLSRVRRAGRELQAFARLRPMEVSETKPEESLDIQRALARLPPRQRAAIILRYFEDLSEHEISERLGCRPGTVKALIHQAKRSLAAQGERLTSRKH